MMVGWKWWIPAGHGFLRKWRIGFTAWGRFNPFIPAFADLALMACNLSCVWGNRDGPTGRIEQGEQAPNAMGISGLLAGRLSAKRPVGRPDVLLVPAVAVVPRPWNWHSFLLNQETEGVYDV